MSMNNSSDTIGNRTRDLANSKAAWTEIQLEFEFPQIVLE